MSADTKIAELLTELHQLIKQTQVSSSTVIKENILELCQVCPTNLNILCVCDLRRRDPAVNITCSTFRKHTRGCRQRTKVSHHVVNSSSVSVHQLLFCES